MSVPATQPQPQVTTGAVLMSRFGIPVIFLGLGYLLGRFGGKK